MDGPEVPKTVAYSQGLSLTEKFQSEGCQTPVIHKGPMTSELLDRNEKLLSLATL